MYSITIKQKVLFYYFDPEEQIVSSKESCELIDMETLRNKIPDTAYNFKDFQEPLIANS